MRQADYYGFRISGLGRIVPTGGRDDCLTA